MSYCVYRHRLKTNGASYIGITMQNPPEKRWQKGKGYSNSSVFDSAIDFFGWDSFDHEILLSGLTEKEAKTIEQYLIKNCLTRDDSLLWYGCNIFMKRNANQYLGFNGGLWAVNKEYLMFENNPIIKKYNDALSDIVSEHLTYLQEHHLPYDKRQLD